MPPRFNPAAQQVQRPLQNELIALHRLLSKDILEQSARILDHFATSQINKQVAGFEPPPLYQTERLLQKCDDFETVCDQVYYILEQSKRILQLDWQQKMALQSEADKRQQEQQEQQQQQQHQHQDNLGADMDGDMSMGFHPSQMDLSIDMDNDPVDHSKDHAHMQNRSQAQLAEHGLEDEDMEELLMLQRDRLDRLRKVIVLGMDAEHVQASQNDGSGKDDLLF
ncbi:hypothetical protein CLU79DRAFT_729821 [Phycomyces nitens]|nr:hypothetical protein CLU79DRAFT_729821 [Phycomyces nitens]